MNYKTSKDILPAIIIYQNRLDLLEATDDETIGKVIMALLSVNRGDNLPNFEKGTPEAMVFNCLYNDYVKNRIHYEEERKKRSEAGKKGGKVSASVRWGTECVD